MPRATKLNKWFKHYTDDGNSKTFLNALNSAKAAGYKAKSYSCFGAIGCQNLKKLKDRVSEWLDNEGLSENTLQLKLKSLMEAKETKFMKVKGFVADEDLPDNVKALGTTGLVSGKENKQAGEVDKKYSAGETLIAIETESIETQRKTLDMALKVKGMYSPEKHEHSGLDGINIIFRSTEKKDG